MRKSGVGYTRILVSSLFMAILALPVCAQDARVGNDVAPDNTRVNMRDRSTGEPTADQAGNTDADRIAMQNIRKALMADKSLSTYAHNIKIISANGKVTLKGPVKSEQERQGLEAEAAKVVGNGNVTNELSVKAAND